MVFTRGLDTCVSIEALEMFILPKLVWIKCLWLCASRDAEARRIVFLFENEEKKEKKPVWKIHGERQRSGGVLIIIITIL